MIPHLSSEELADAIAELAALEAVLPNEELTAEELAELLAEAEEFEDEHFFDSCNED